MNVPGTVRISFTVYAERVGSAVPGAHFLWWAAGRSTNFRASNASREAKFRATRFLRWNKWKKSESICSEKELEQALSRASCGKRPGSSIGCWSKVTPRRILRARWFANFEKKKVERRRADRNPRVQAAGTDHHCMPGNGTRGPNPRDAATIRLGRDDRTSFTVRIATLQRLAASPSIFNAPEKSEFRRGDKYSGTLKSSSRMLGLV